MKKGKTVVLGISSGIAAFKIIELIQLLKKDVFDVHVVMTQNAARMVNPAVFESVLQKDSVQARMTDKKVFTELFKDGFDYKNILKTRKVDHIQIADKADIFVVAPATANSIAKIANGFADEFLTTSLLATQAPVLVCPSMNTHMWENPVVQENISKLRSRGFFILEPENGDLACGYRGKGRLAHIYHIRDEIISILQKKDLLKGKKIIVTAGGTIEKIDDVRFIANKSSGKMGIAIANECFYRGADVLLLRSKTAIKPQVLIKEKEFEGIEELEALIKKYVKDFDVIFHTAAVSDFQVKKSDKGKVTSDKNIELLLTPTKKIINAIKKINPKIKLVGFKAVWGLKEKDIAKILQKKFKESRADVIVINDVSKSDRGFGADTNEVFAVKNKGEIKKFSLASKTQIAKNLIDFLF